MVFTGIFPGFALCIYFVCHPSGLCSAFGFMLDYVMDSDNSSSALLAGKVCLCHCGKRMSSLTKDFHTICIDSRGVDFDVDHRCVERTDIDDSPITEYVRHKLTLRCKLKSKHKLKELKLSDVADMAGDPALDDDVGRDAPLSVKPQLTVENILYPISTLPEHIHSTILLYAKIT